MFSFAVALLATTFSVASAAAPGYSYVSPVPGSRFVSPGNNIALRTSSFLDPAVVRDGAISVQGSNSGSHAGRLTLARDGRTLIFVPDEPFQPGERVTATVNAADGRGLPPLAFEFTISTANRGLAAPVMDEREVLPSVPPSFAAEAAANPTTLGGPLPPSYPPIIVQVDNDPEPGAIFITPNRPGAGARGNLVILDRRGEPLFYRRSFGRAFDFRMQPNGLLAYFDESVDAYLVLDSTYAVVDAFATQNGYITDLHELQILPNGHALLMAYDPQPVRMDSVVTGGNPNAIVTGLIIQELDEDKNVVFQWRSWDHFQITDALPCAVNLLGASIDYAHGNAIELDQDGNLLISSRHMNEIPKIDRSTGDVIWRFGPNAVNNQFTIVGDSRGFSHQHDVRRLPNGHLTLFDNGNCLSPEYSRGLEYALDEVTKVATLVWEYRNTPDIYGRATGNTQRRPSGGTMINWGFGAVVTDLAPDDSKTFQLAFGLANMLTYRAVRQPWTTNRFVLDADTVDFGAVTLGAVGYRPLTLHNPTSNPVEIDYFHSTDTTRFEVTEPMPVVLEPGGERVVEVRFRPTDLAPVEATLYARAVNDTELVAQTVELKGTGSLLTGEPTPEPGAFFVSPCPSRGATRIGFTLPGAARTRISVLDALGRTHAVFDRQFTAGRHEVVWEPTDAVPPGLYFVRCRSENVDRVLRLVRVR
jgi:hypothetical protein